MIGILVGICIWFIIIIFDDVIHFSDINKRMKWTHSLFLFVFCCSYTSIAFFTLGIE